ncbi:uncharacterized protein LOC134299415 isoform X2 [Anolis carolinensis]|uniref:uncharacterized protein LOC134295165 isoform X2 n=1 Tax=Anolis carolinensis TaxID=28377 RepID=UPI002F2B61AE
MSARRLLKNIQKLCLNCCKCCRGRRSIKIYPVSPPKEDLEASSSDEITEMETWHQWMASVSQPGQDARRKGPSLSEESWSTLASGSDEDARWSQQSQESSEKEPSLIIEDLED